MFQVNVLALFESGCMAPFAQGTSVMTIKLTIKQDGLRLDLEPRASEKGMSSIYQPQATPLLHKMALHRRPVVDLDHARHTTALGDRLVVIHNC
jgi:hypothetical protein